MKENSGVIGATVTDANQIFPQIYLTDQVRKMKEERLEKKAMENSRKMASLENKQQNENDETSQQKIIDL